MNGPFIIFVSLSVLTGRAKTFVTGLILTVLDDISNQAKNVKDALKTLLGFLDRQKRGLFITRLSADDWRSSVIHCLPLSCFCIHIII